MTAPEFVVNKCRIAPSELMSTHFAEFSASIMPCCCTAAVGKLTANEKILIGLLPNY